MNGHECYHCKQWVEKGEPHDCWTTTEAALTADLSDDLRDAWERLRETAAEFGEQRIYASHHSIMFARKACYFFVRPKKKFLEVCVFLDRPIHSPNVRRVERPSRAKVANVIRITHRDEVEAPFTDWLRDAYDLPDRLAAQAAKGAGLASLSPSRRSNVAKKATRKTARKTARKSSAKRTAVKNRAGSFYAKRKTSGRFSEMDEKGRSLGADRRKKAKKKVKSGYGDQGDRRTSSKKR
jgi:hypothetical protein